MAEQKIRSQEELEVAYTQISKESYSQAQEKALEEEEEKRAVLKEMLAKLENQLRTLEAERKTDHGAMKHQLKALIETEHQLKSETSKLSRALRSPAGRGRWGEIQLRRVVELAGMIEHCDFIEQGFEITDGIRRKPDLIIKLPGQRQVIIDAKVPLEAYLEGIDQTDEVLRGDKFKQHAKQLKDHITILGKKNYWEHFQPTPEFVVLFLPSETIFAAALETDPTLMESAALQGVILATPMTLIALLKAVAYGWKQESLSRYAERVSELGQELYKRVSDLTGHWSHLGKALDQAITAFNQATGSLERNVLSSARKFSDLGAASSLQPLKEIPLVDQTARPFVAAELKAAQEGDPEGN
ncbi:MAG: DNA recombination protein RmuC [Rhabdochlamydiaceae bacterium]|nr:DNA recombination protein RmuC [Rhabdochlamydiaceae bacterium]